MKSLVELLAFRRMIAPVILQILFWGAIGGVLYGTYVLVVLGSWAWPLSLRRVLTSDGMLRPHSEELAVLRYYANSVAHLGTAPAPVPVREAAG